MSYLPRVPLTQKMNVPRCCPTGSQCRLVVLTPTSNRLLSHCSGHFPGKCRLLYSDVYYHPISHHSLNERSMCDVGDDGRNFPKYFSENSTVPAKNESIVGATFLEPGELLTIHLSAQGAVRKTSSHQRAGEGG